MRDVQMLSGGGGSWWSAKQVRKKTGASPDLLFSDTLIEDDDLYRFVIEGSANILQRPAAVVDGLKWFWDSIPPLDRPEERLAHLSHFAQEAMSELPGLHWIQEGRTPWEVFRKSRFLGNSRVAKCSHVLKQDACRAWLEENCDPADTTIYIGIHWSEMERFAGGKDKPGAKQLWLPWRCEAPLCESPFLPASDMLKEMDREGIKRPRLYALGFNHNNCGGFCVKAGQAHFRNLLRQFPDRYAFHERQEQELREYLDKDVAILRDRRGGATRPLTLREFRERIEAGGECDLFDWGGCGCFSSVSEEAA